MNFQDQNIQGLLHHILSFFFQSGYRAAAGHRKPSDDSFVLITTSYQPQKTPIVFQTEEELDDYTDVEKLFLKPTPDIGGASSPSFLRRSLNGRIEPENLLIYVPSPLRRKETHSSRLSINKKWD